MATNQKDLLTLHHLWKQLGDIPVGDDGATEEPFLHFDEGTDREDIWHWFEAQNPDFSVGMVMEGAVK